MFSVSTASCDAALGEENVPPDEQRDDNGRIAMNLTQNFWLGKRPDDYSLLPINTCFAAASSFSPAFPG
jgi:hypothetical protein